ncbi:DUF6851 domain-containing protein [Lyngbya sp. CCY1209]|uniref:DUF6851 domain-containing protein n=1 Tax=Lyngbya sp. CCY1209 TaxID=2886103 RepID=UPI002D204F9F|nr:calcium-binding protein [Lyngbya sp. CCY1209]MEB3881985.1 calcium-binding protein [Lyngbya sp. CCY1209]
MDNSASENNDINLILHPETQRVTVDDPSPTISVRWDRVAQEAVINTAPGPTIASRAYGMVHTAIYDAWSAYDPLAVGTQLGDALQQPQSENTAANKAEAMSFAAYRVLSELFPTQVDLFDELMADLGYDPDDTAMNGSTPAGIGNISAEALLTFRRNDGSNQLGNHPNGDGTPYSDISGYQPVNPPGDPRDIERWTPERVPMDAQPGQEQQVQRFLTPHWGYVVPFSFASESGGRSPLPQPFLSFEGEIDWEGNPNPFPPDFGQNPPHFSPWHELRPPEPEPFLLVDGEVDLQAGTIALSDGSSVPISPDIVGTIINPEFIEQTEQVVDYSAYLTDEHKLIAEFWEDAGGTSFPPGTWMTFGQYVSARDDHTLDEDVKLFLNLGNAVFDAGIATWEAKVYYDYARPVRTVRELGELGLIGEFDSELGGFAIEAWGGPGEGIQTILATDFLTYQTPGSDPSPPFAEYVSGHSTFSAAGAEILRRFTGGDDFGAAVTFEPEESRFEPGMTPHTPVTLEWETFGEAADEAGISRLYGGIHFQDGDLNGRSLGRQVAGRVWEQTHSAIAPNTIVGTDGDDGLSGTRENDLIRGGGGDDFIRGLTGNDVLYGGANDDNLDGSMGDDIIAGDGGDDFLIGGPGGDRFDFGAGDGNDIIADFRDGIDIIGLKDDLTFEQLSVSRVGHDTRISAPQLSMTLLGVESSAIDVDDFIEVLA